MGFSITKCLLALSDPKAVNLFHYLRYQIARGCQDRI
jgi:hypothetical protein